MRISPNKTILFMSGVMLLANEGIPAGTPLGTIYDQAIHSHLHFEVGIGKRNYTNFVNLVDIHAAAGVRKVQLAGQYIAVLDDLPC